MSFKSILGKQKGVGSQIILSVPLCLSLGLAAAMAQSPTAGTDHFDATAFGAKADGKSDDTAAIQKALDAAAKVDGVVRLRTGQYLVAGSLKIPAGVSLVGNHQTPVLTNPLIGTVILATGGRDKEDAPALFEMGNSSAVRSLTVFYPDQKLDDVRPYAWTFHLQGSDNTVENVTLINSYNGIRIGPEPTVRHRIRSVVGSVLRRGILVDNCWDIGRIENVHWVCEWWQSKQVRAERAKVYDYMLKNCEGFIFGKSDNQYVTNTFIYPAKIGYRFISTEHGAMYGQLCGIGADATHRCIQVDG
ncbi:MAG: glycoside hydrolase family 55 protein, partial [Planctomycetes bacterium]|nr:glycoside hydrolase family 55 protein [Planctomycetota bacterium]